MKYVLFAVLLGLTGCGMSAQRAQQMHPFQLVQAHEHHLALWNRADMVIVDELVARGGLDAAARVRYAEGGQCHTATTGTGYSYDWAAMGVPAEAVSAFYSGRTHGLSHTVFTSRGAVSFRSYGSAGTLRSTR